MLSSAMRVPICTYRVACMKQSKSENAMGHQFFRLCGVVHLLQRFRGTVGHTEKQSR